MKNTKDDFSNQFRFNLKKLRLTKKLEQKQLAEKFGLSKSAISAWELGRNEPNFLTLIKLADFFNVDLRAFLTEEL